MATGFTLMWSKMLDSSVWRQKSKETRLVWVTLLLMKDADGVVRSGVPGIMDRARVSRKECEEALRELSEPDEDTMTQEHEGRRIKKVGEGWLVLNHEKYRTSVDLRAKWSSQKRSQRERLKIGETISGAIRRKVREDPITKADEATMKRKNRASKVEAEYDLDEE